MAQQQTRQPGRNGFKYRPQYGVIVICDGEQSQRQTFEKLKSAGHKVRVVCV